MVITTVCAHCRNHDKEPVMEINFRDGKIYYIYANAYEKQLYVGNEAAYNEYKELQHQKQVSEDKIADARNALMEANEEADYAGRMDWGLWAPYGY